MPPNLRVAARYRAATRATEIRREGIPVVVIGAGPYGLATAAWLNASGVRLRIFGEPMQGWDTHMPEGMFLKSVPAASSISAPEPGYGFADFRAAQGREPVGDLYPIPVDEFIDYGRWFQERRVPEVERSMVRHVQAVDGGFSITLDSGEEFLAAAVVVSTGLAPFAHEPPELRGLAATGRTSHTCEHRNLTGFAGQQVAVLGAGQSALESAALLHEAGASPTVVARAPSVLFGDPPQADLPSARPRSTRLHKPGSPLGPGWSLLAVSRGAAAYRHLPTPVRFRLLHTVLGPSGAWWLRERVAGRFPVLCGRTVRSAEPEDGAVLLELTDPGGGSERLRADHLLMATGYRVDVDRLELLEPTLRQAVRTVGGAPRLSAGFESSVPGLYFTGLAAAPSFGPFLRFVCGTDFAARQLAASVAARNR
ncbi:cation diffusion facilitator CzcD-associated flavoprotein CzcO [Streptomyces sp. SLBN-118]|uniref:FAD-dependent oxidoreductase n=1 Tax=Streptomyces sp. SLBN-118 TaxID=2768454 RepID=UPI00114E32F8|nr:FAD-dependent oxidoreductase [Streptomyces sp. SLBN-118]TQK50811.1 cation diffusion facilitator CzcD-associated flavoprotein CzcO [Streptomyces sp. SLBN-118]